MSDTNNGSQWARESVASLRDDVRGVRKEITAERMRQDHNNEIIIRKLDDITIQVSEMRGVHRVVSSLWGAAGGAAAGITAWMSGVGKG